MCLSLIGQAVSRSIKGTLGRVGTSPGRHDLARRSAHQSVADAV